jgi:hypothetical protein
VLGEARELRLRRKHQGQRLHRRGERDEHRHVDPGMVEIVLRAGQREEAQHHRDQRAGGGGVGDHPLAREMQRVEDDVGEERGRGDDDQRSDRLAALLALRAQEGALDLGIDEALQHPPQARLLLLGTE